MLRHLTRLKTIVLLAAFALAAMPLAPAIFAQGIEFRFAPNDGAVEERRIKVTRVTQLEGEDDQVDELEKVVRIEKRKTAGGFTITERLVSARSSHDGESTENPILAALLEVDIVKEAGDDGKLHDVRGYDKIVDVLNAKFPEAAAEWSAAIDAAEMAAQEKSEWEATVGRFAGKQAQIGDVWNGNEAFAPGGQGDGNVLASVRFARFVPCGGRRCVQLDLTFGSEGQAAGNEVANVFEDAAHNKGQWVGQTGSAVTGVSGRGERVIDPATMDLVSEKIERTIRILVDVPGEGKLPMVIRETSETAVAPRP